jgi:hypothetical protein
MSVYVELFYTEDASPLKFKFKLTYVLARVKTEDFYPR